VFAILLTNSSRAIPDVVKFRRDATKGGEVQLIEETSSLIAGTLLGAFTLGALGLLFMFRPWRA
jgi:hypothetical protein